MAGGLLATPAVAATGDAASGGIDWGPCSSERLQQAGAECGFVSAPMDYGDPSGKQIKIAVSRVKHTVPEDEYQGVMLVNPGGPGGSGLGLATLGANVPNHAGDAYDWIGFDPRGVGASKPSLSCLPNYFSYDRPKYVPTNADLERIWLARSKAYADACARDGGELLDNMKTTDSVRDMESIRKALGAEQINYYGFSYGTYLGQVYGTLFPDRVRRMVLDSNVDPRDVWYQADLNQDIAFDRNIKIWFSWLAKYDDVFHLGATEADVEKLFYDEQATLDEHAAGGLIGGDEWTDIFLQAGYYRMTWVDLGKAFAGWVHDKDWKTLREHYDSSSGRGDDNGFAVYLAVQCTDKQWPQKWSTWRRDNWRVYAKAPFETWDNAWYNAPCLYWHGDAGTPVTVDGSKVDSALLIDETLDAATPYKGSLEVRKRFPNASLIAEPGGTTHADSLWGDACVDNRIAA